MELYPIHFDDDTHMLDKNGKIDNPEIFKAVCNGYDIDLSMNKDERGESNIIDIWELINLN